MHFVWGDNATEWEWAATSQLINPNLGPINWTRDLCYLHNIIQSVEGTIIQISLLNMEERQFEGITLSI